MQHQWSIFRKHRQACTPAGALLVVANDRQPSGAYRWAIFLVDGDERCMMAEGETWNGNVRVAMKDAEARAAVEGWA